MGDNATHKVAIRFSITARLWDLSNSVYEALGTVES